MSDFPRCLFAIGEHVEPDLACDSEDRQTPPINFVVLDRNHKVIPWDGEWQMWFMTESPQSVTLALSLYDELLPQQPPEVAYARAREFVVGLGTNILELRVKPQMGEYPGETFVLAEPCQATHGVDITVDWRVKRFAQLPDLAAKLDQLLWWKFASPAVRPFMSDRERAIMKRGYEVFRKAEREAHRCLWNIAKRLPPASGHYFPLEIRDGRQVTLGVIRLREWIGDRFFAKLFLLGPRDLVRPGTQLHRLVTWDSRGKTQSRQVLLGVVSELI